MCKKRLFCILLLLAAFSTVMFGQKQPKVDFGKKIAEATPTSLPQQPVPQRPSTDARDRNLKGKVKTVVESSLEGNNRYTVSEELFDLTGNLLKTVDYDQNYPKNVTVWGYVNGKRVSKWGNDIKYASGEKPKPKQTGFDLIQTLGNPDSPGDTRFDSRKEYGYDALGRLTSEATYGHSDDLFNRFTYSYKDNERDKRAHDSEGNEISRTVEILDKDGNITEEHSYGRYGKYTVRFLTYEFDQQGNWVVQKTYDAEGKKGRKLAWITFRTITYYS